MSEIAKKLAVYIAGPLNAEAVGYIKNVSTMLGVANQVRRLGFVPFVPCMDVLLGIYSGGMNYEDYFNMSQVWLERADAVYKIAPSPGTDREIQTAQELGIPVFESLDALEVWGINMAKKATTPATYHGHPRFYELLAGLRDLHDRKNHDYAGADDPLRNFRKCQAWGLDDFKGCFVRMGDKFSRMEEFLKKGILEVKDETVIDTARDLAVYSLLFIILFEEKKAENSK